MKILAPLFLSLVLITIAAPSFAQQPDLSLSLHVDIDGEQPVDRVAVGRTIHYAITWDIVGPGSGTGTVLEVNVPGVATDLDSFPELSCTGGDPIRCTFPESAGALSVLHLEVRIDTPGVHTTTARLIRQDGSSDPNPSNDIVTHTFEAFARPSLELHPSVALLPLEPLQQGTFSVNVRNHSATPATNLVVTVRLPAGGTIDGFTPRLGNPNCVLANNALNCTAASLGAEQFLYFDVAFTAPPGMDGQDLIIDMAVTAAEEDFDDADNRSTRHAVMIRQFVVSNVNDEGGGSLRQAMLDVRSLCAVTKPCAILFRIPGPVPQNGWFTIQPRTRLPEIPGTLTMDGRTQTLFTGDTNPEGPEIEIDGAFVAEGSGLLLRPHCEMTVRNLAVNGFPGYGMEVRQRGIGTNEDACVVGSSLFHPATIRENYLGTDPRGRIAKPNHRGLGIFTAESFAFENLISGNRRSGIYVEQGAYHLIGGNRIGVASDGSPLGNGAGIFIDMGIPGTEGANDFIGADIIGNVIANNDGMAIARTRQGEIWITENSIFDNLQQGIDAGVDGMTPQRADDRDVPNAPVLFSASYDPAGDVTIVRGRIDSEAFASIGLGGGTGRTLEIYASLRLSKWFAPQAERSVAIASIASGHQDFEIVVPGDFRGMWITATYSVSHFLGLARGNPRGPSAENHRGLGPADTSELSNAITVH